MFTCRERLAGQQLPSRTSAEWIEYFHKNAKRLRPIPWHLGIAWTAAERAAVVRSIQTFQLGESGEGRHILHVAEQYSQVTGDFDYLEALKLFLAEEHRHAAALGHVLDLAGEPRLTQEWTDHCFRWLRHRAGLELAIVVLLTAEVLAQVYYAALRRATRSPVLVRVCSQILADEAAHVRFQSERLALLRRGQSWLTRALRTCCERVLFAAACLVVWHGHRSVFRAASVSFRSFWRRAHSAFRHSLVLRNPRWYVGTGSHSAVAPTTHAKAAAAFPLAGHHSQTWPVGNTAAKVEL